MSTRILYIFCLIALLLSGCRNDDIIFIPETVPVSKPELSTVAGLYLLNEGNMGTNKSTLDYYDYTTGIYTRNIYAQANPTVPKELGDVGNDIAIYGAKLWAVINVSNKVEVMDSHTVKRIGQVNIPNCRFIAFHDRYAYVTSYAGPVVIDPDYKQRGYVAKIDTATLQVVDTCLVGFQPDQLAIVGGKIYVCNSGGYMAPNYENSLSVIDLETFVEEGRIPIAINLSHVVADRRGVLWIVSRGNYADVAPSLHAYDTRKQRTVFSISMNIGNIALQGDSLYIIGSKQFAPNQPIKSDTYAILNVATHELVSTKFITDGTEAKIAIPYSVAINPVNGDIFVTDAKNYVTPGTLHCYSQQGQLKWSVRTGDIPAHITFLGEQQK